MTSEEITWNQTGMPAESFKNLTFINYIKMIATGTSAYLAGSILTCLTAFLTYIIITKTIKNRYTRIAMGELLVALLLRIASCFFYGTASR
jgi:hypothetical protein